MKLAAYSIHVLLLLALSACTVGPDYTPDVTAAAASWGAAPVYSHDGRMLAPGGGGNTSRKTMLHD